MYVHILIYIFNKYLDPQIVSKTNIVQNVWVLLSYISILYNTGIITRFIKEIY